MGNASRHAGALTHVRICDLSGQLAGAGATRVLASFGAQVIRIEDPVTKGLWDIVRQLPPFLGGDRSNEGGSGFNNHNVEKLGITLNLRTPRGRELFAELVRVSDAVTENFAAGVLARLGFGYPELKRLRSDIVYVSNCGFGHVGPYASYKTWGPLVQAVSGLTFQSGLPGQPPAGWGYSFMDHTGAYFMAIALLSALLHRRRTGEGQWVDLSCTDAAATLNGPALLDYTVNGRPLRRDGMPDANRSQSPLMVPHNIYAAAGEDRWVALACRNDDDWAAVAGTVAEAWCADERFATLEGRAAATDEVDGLLAAWFAERDRDDAVGALRRAGVPCAAVVRPPERCDHDADNAAWGLWPTVRHSKHGPVRVDGLPVHLSRTDWRIERGGPLLGEDNERVFGEVLGLSSAEVGRLAAEGVI